MLFYIATHLLCVTWITNKAQEKEDALSQFFQALQHLQEKQERNLLNLLNLGEKLSAHSDTDESGISLEKCILYVLVN